MLKMSECVEVLERNTPKEYRHDMWITDRSCFTVLVLFLEGLTIAVDKTEVEGKTDAEVEKLIKDKMLTTLRDAIIRLCPNYFEEPQLGYATTRQLLAEIKARIKIDGQLDYRTVDAD